MDIQINQNEACDWWNAESDDDIHSRLTAFYQKLRNDDTPRLELIRRHMRLYGNVPVSSLGMARNTVTWNDDRLRLNVIKSACDTVAAKICKNRPKPRPLTSGGNWSFRKKAKALEHFFDAQFYISGVGKVAPLVFVDAAVMGTGIGKTYEGPDRKISVDRVFPGEIFVDEMDGLYGDPRMIVQRKYFDRQALIKMFPKFKAQIVMAKMLADHDEDFDHRDDIDQVLVLEAWRRPSTPKAKDGKHVIIIDGATLLAEDWKRALPFVFIRWSNPLRGFWGVGLAEELTGIQIEINRLLQKIQAAFHLVSVPRVFVEEGSKVMKAYLNNKVGMVVPYRGTKPIFEVAQAVHPEMFAHLERLYQRAFEIAGISSLSAGGQKPSGLDSGVALRTFHDIETERFSMVGKAWEQMHLDIALQMVEVAKEIGGNFAIQTGKYSIQQIDWSEIDMERDAYVLQVFPQSALPSTPAGRLAAVQEMMDAGLLTPQQGTELLDFPDTDRFMSLARAIPDNIDRIIERLLDEEDYFEAPEPYLDLELALRKAQALYNQAQEYDDIPDERLEKLRRWMRLCHRLLKAAMAEQQSLMAPPAPGAPPPPGANGAPPMAAQQSDGVRI